MGRGKDLKPRGTPKRVYATVPDEDATRIVAVTLRPYHLFLLDQMAMDATGIAPRLQKLVEEEAASQGVGMEEWQRCQQKEKYMKGVRGSRPAQLEKRKEQRREITP